MSAQVDFGIFLNDVEVFSDIMSITSVGSIGGPPGFFFGNPAHLTVTQDRLFNGIFFPSNALRLVADPFTYVLDISSVSVGSTYKVGYSFGIQAIGSEATERLAHAQFWDPINGGGFEIITDGVTPVPPGPTPPGPGPGPAPIPEPGTFLLLGTGLVGLGAWKYRTQLKTCPRSEE